jgi:hypothetical protein
MIQPLAARSAASDGRNDDALLPSVRPESRLAFGPIWARLADHPHLPPGLAAASAAGGATASAPTAEEAT